jgi:hypothetical protein
VINNAGIAQSGACRPTAKTARRIFETNYFAMHEHGLRTILKANGGGALLNVLSIASLGERRRVKREFGQQGGRIMLTNALRNELAAQKTQVLGLCMATSIPISREVLRCQRGPGHRQSRARRARSRARRSAADELTRQVAYGGAKADYQAAARLSSTSTRRQAFQWSKCQPHKDHHALHTSFHSLASTHQSHRHGAHDA